MEGLLLVGLGVVVGVVVGAVVTVVVLRAIQRRHDRARELNELQAQHAAFSLICKHLFLFRHIETYEELQQELHNFLMQFSYHGKEHRSGRWWLTIGGVTKAIGKSLAQVGDRRSKEMEQVESAYASNPHWS
jgi:uncharacterized membrane protein YjgN (DUF898 family)